MRCGFFFLAQWLILNFEYRIKKIPLVFQLSPRSSFKSWQVASYKYEPQSHKVKILVKFYQTNQHTMTLLFLVSKAKRLQLHADWSLKLSIRVSILENCMQREFGGEEWFGHFNSSVEWTGGRGGSREAREGDLQFVVLWKDGVLLNRLTVRDSIWIQISCWVIDGRSALSI